MIDESRSLRDLGGVPVKGSVPEVKLDVKSPHSLLLPFPDPTLLESLALHFNERRCQRLALLSWDINSSCDQAQQNGGMELCQYWVRTPEKCLRSSTHPPPPHASP